MKREFLGDSYDAVKRLWREVLLDYAPLHAEPRFIPPELEADFEKLTRIPLLRSPPTNRYSILNDPDTGICQPGAKRKGRTHILLGTICDQLRRPHVQSVITFDQSHHRSGSLNRTEQRNAKMRYLADAGVDSFYYVSHAPFLFAFSSPFARQEMRQRLEEFGIPMRRLESSLAAFRPE